VARLLNSLDRWNLEWRLICGAPDDQVSAPSRLQGKCLFLPLHRRGPVARLHFGWRASWLAAGLRPSLIHIHGSEYGWGLRPALVAHHLLGLLERAHRVSEPPCVLVTCHGTLKGALTRSRQAASGRRAWILRLAALLLGFVESRVFGCASDVICVSDKVKQEIISHHRVPVTRVHVIPNAVDRVPAQESPAMAREAGLLLWVGSDAVEKDLSSLLKMFPAIRAECSYAELLIVGPVTQSAFDGIRFAGVRSPAEMQRLYSKAQLMISTSLYEGDPLSVKEAMQAGTPVVVTEAASSAVRDGVTGSVCRVQLQSEHGRREFVRRIVELLESRSLWERLSRGARAASSAFSPDREERAYEELYSSRLRRMPNAGSL
jgi:glycosyltransferase involved in cell wall biosynthesis